MPRTYRHITFEKRGDVCCARLRSLRLEEESVHELAEELLDLAAEVSPKLALSLGPRAPQCLYSVFLSKLVTVQRQLHEQGGELVLCDVSPEVQSVFAACRLEDQFRFLKDFDEAVARWTA
jgi:anti-anti-sigma factor